MSTTGNWRGPNIVKDGLVLYLDAGSPNSYYSQSGGIAWKDISGNGNNGVLTNGPTYSSSNGGSFIFDGTNDYSTINYTIPLNSTVIVWFRQTSAASKGILETTGGGTQSGTPNLYVLAGSGTLQTYAFGGSPQYSTIDTYSYNTWYQLSIVRTPTTENTYLNGVIKLSNKSLTNSTNSTFNIGVGFAGYFNGDIPQTLIYNRALTSSEVLQNYNATKSRFGL